MSILNKDARGAVGKKRSRPVDVEVVHEIEDAKLDLDVKPAFQKQSKKDKIKRRRLHVAGLPAISEQEGVDRFKSFGNVVNVDGLGKLDDNGVPLRYAFIDIETTKSKLSQCMNLLSGSVWKGSTLRIAEAKRSRLEKIDAERKQEARKEAAAQVAPAAAEPTTALSSKKRKKPEGAGTDSELVTIDNVRSKKGWKLDPLTKTPIFSITMRPDRPLPSALAAPPVVAISVAPVMPSRLPSANERKVAKSAEKEARKAARKAAKKAELKGEMPPPTRARRVKIDSTRWQKQHLRGEQIVDEADRHKGEYDANSLLHAAPSQQPDPDEDTVLSSEEDNDDDDADDSERMEDGAEPRSDLREHAAELRAPAEIKSVENVAKGSSDDGLDCYSSEQIDNDINSDNAWTNNDESPNAAEVPAEERSARPAADGLQFQQLTEIFRPQEAGPVFSLADLLNEDDMDELPIDHVDPYTALGESGSLSFVPSMQHDTTPSTYPASVPSRFSAQNPTFFMFPFDGDFEEGGAFAKMADKDRVAMLDRSWTGIGESRRFKRTQTLEEITVQHDAARRVLNEQVRKRHREAVRKYRRGMNKSVPRYADED